MKKTFIPALLWLVIITGLSVMPGVQLPKFNLFAADKLGHAFVYGVLVWLILRAFMQRGGPTAQSRPTATAGQTATALSFAAAYGVLMEFVQYTFIPGRFYEYDDMLANAIGALSGWIVYKVFKIK